MKADSGFTLLEMMIVVAIGGVLLAIGVPSMVGMIRDNRIAAQANELVTTLAMARGEALKRNTPVIVCRAAGESNPPACGTGTGWTGGWAMFVDTDRNSAFTAGEQVLNVHGPLTGDNTMTSSTNVTDLIIYTAQGVARGTGAAGVGFNFLLQDSRGSPKGVRLLCIAITGRVRTFSDGRTACPT